MPANPLTPPVRISRLPYVGGLDGLRALAVAAVIVYHGDRRWLPGGFLGVEVFFVISGYLITLLLIGEHERTGRISLRGFWTRRFRRLLPALYVTLALVTVYLATFWRAAQGRTRGDIVAGLTYTSNWYQIWVGQSYTATEAFVPLRHLWSLAVEEQFYLVWPLVMIVLLRLGRRRLPAIGAVLLGLSAALAVMTAVLFVPGDIEVTCPAGGGSGYATVFGRCLNINDALYLGSASRASGLMLGAGLAVFWRPVAIMRGRLRARGRVLDVVALVGLAGAALATWRLTLSGVGHEFGMRYDARLFRGGLFATGLATVALIAAVTHQRAWTSRVLAIAPLRWVGIRSYGLYLYHWPVFQVLRRDRAPELPVDRFLIGVAVTVVFAEWSFRFVEMPVRQGRLGEWLRGQRRPRTAWARRRARAMLGWVSVVGLVTAAAGVSVGLADNSCVSGQECDNEAAVALGTVALGTVALTGAVTDVGTGAATGRGTVPVLGTDPGTVPATSGTTPGTVPATSGTTSGTTSGGGSIGTGAGSGPQVTGSTTDTTQATMSTSPPTPTIAPGASTSGSVASLGSGPKPLALGESVMLGARPELEAAGIRVDAAISRQGPDMADLVERLGAMGAIPPTLIIQIGTNGLVPQSTFDRIMAQAPTRLVPRVFFLTVKAPKPWVPENNRLIRALPQKYPNVRVIDWETLGATISEELSRTDRQVHLRTPKAKEVYTEMIVAALTTHVSAPPPPIRVHRVVPVQRLSRPSAFSGSVGTRRTLRP